MMIGVCPPDVGSVHDARAVVAAPTGAVCSPHGPPPRRGPMGPVFGNRFAVGAGAHGSPLVRFSPNSTSVHDLRAGGCLPAGRPARRGASSPDGAFRADASSLRELGRGCRKATSQQIAKRSAGATLRVGPFGFPSLPDGQRMKRVRTQPPLSSEAEFCPFLDFPCHLGLPRRELALSMW